VDDLDEISAAKVVTTDGKYLLDSYWGSYVAIISCLERRTRTVLRDPTGRLPCFHTEVDQVHLIFADIGDVMGVDRYVPRIDDNAVQEFLLFGDRATGRTGLSNVAELLAGESLKISYGRPFPHGAVTRSMSWDPRLLDVDENKDFDAAAGELCSIAEECVGAWSRLHRSALLSLSGGFDSAVVLGLLNAVQHRSDITCFNRYSDAPDGDERSYARIVAAHSGKKLIEIALDESRTELSTVMARVPRTEKPTGGVTEINALLKHSEIAVESKATAVFTGRGGDEIFFRTKTPLVAADYAKKHGFFNARMFGVATQVARMIDAPVWDVLRAAMRPDAATNYEFTRRLHAVRDSPFLSRHVERNHTIEVHPWGDRTIDVPPARALQIFILSKSLNMQRPFDRVGRLHYIDVLMSQPIVEACLRIPTYQLTKGGSYRALASRAFGKILPPEIVRRRTKGTTQTYYFRMISQNREFLREFLLDGALANKGLLNRQAIDRTLSASHTFVPEELGPLWLCVGAESWLQAWSEGP
jgi:asparagine synthase (glutamine-hydrolysing)